ncbi:hypothetical protein O3P69_016150 [Scylla paramamosain]|uniref:Uncharacterized protein n=1 Tax=Scylla paramamosain TaxID=85552 RepID=A0AAW0SFX1_SCYPA
MGCACIPGKEATFKDSLDKSISYAKALDVPMIHIMVGKFDKNHTEEEHARTLEKNLRYAANLLNQEGIVGTDRTQKLHHLPRVLPKRLRHSCGSYFQDRLAKPAASS